MIKLQLILIMVISEEWSRTWRYKGGNTSIIYIFTASMDAYIVKNLFSFFMMKVSFSIFIMINKGVLCDVCL